LNIPYLGEFAAIFTAVCWSLSALAFTSSSRLVGSQVVNRLRVLIGFLALLVLNWVVFGTPVPLKTGNATWLWLLLSGLVGLAIGDSIAISHRARLIAELLESADVIIESAVVLTQEIHDGPYETFTGHGIWAGWQGVHTYRLENKKLIRVDLDSALDRAWRFERESRAVQEAIDKGLPKTKLMDIPFRMEMSGFARLEGSLPIIADIGVAWPILAAGLEERLGIALNFISAPQQTPEGQRMRDWIADEIQPVRPVREKALRA